MKVVMVVASTVLWVRLFQSQIVCGETTVVGIVCSVLVAHIGRCGLFFVRLQQAVICLSCCSCRPFCVNFIQHGEASSSASALE